MAEIHEKIAVEIIEDTSANSPGTDFLEPIDAILERRVRWKCDFHLLPILYILLLLIILDRVNIGNARIQGLEEDLNMVGHQYNIALFIFFVTYILCEVPSNFIIKHVRPSIWLSGMVFCCGVITTLQGVTQSFGGLVACRFLLGVFEAGFFPGCIYLISMYYKRYEVQLRITFFLSGSIIGGGVSGLLAYAISNMDGIGGYSTWRWIFIIEGMTTSAVAAISYFFIPDWPETANFLTAEEHKLLLRGLAADAPEGSMNKYSKKAVKRILSDPKIYLGILQYIGVATTGYSAAFFIPTILSEFGWTPVHAQVMTIPIFVCASFMTCIVALCSDIIKHRYAFAMLGCSVAATGYAILLNTQTVAIPIRYMALFFITTGGFITLPVIISWLNNNMGGHYKRSMGAALQIGFGNSAGFIASNVYITAEAPFYKTGYSTGLSLILMVAVVNTILLVYLIWENKQRENGKRDNLFSLPPDEVSNLGDDHPHFRFGY